LEKKNLEHHSINEIEKNGEPPVCAAPEEIQTALIGMPSSFDIVSSDPDGRITGIDVVDLPRWAEFEIITELPAADAVARISGIPGSEDTGLHVMSIVATDNDGNRIVSPLKVNVPKEGFKDEQPGVF